MICPKCHGEYREGFNWCVDCEVDLVDALPAPEANASDRDQDYVTVLSSGDPALIPLAKSVLQDLGIPYVEKGGLLQDLFGAGRVGLGFNPIVGPVEIQVASHDAEAALEALDELVDHGGPQTALHDPEEAGVEENANGPEMAIADAIRSRAPSFRARAGFRLLVLADLFTMFLGQVLYQRLVWRIPEELWEHLDAVLPPGIIAQTYSQWFLLWILLSLIASIGLLTFWAPARFLYVIVWCWFLSAAALGSATIDDGLGSSLSMLGHLLGGAIVALCFYGPLSYVFERKSAGRARDRSSLSRRRSSPSR
jgi:hypothetical protein